jgi:pyridinium-3,5-bisthiocarboxylic acid mononucleotide nickel chelatase
VFDRLAEAEAEIHGVAKEKVHFHEVGAVDSICDIVASCHAPAILGIDQVQNSPINTGGGTISSEHGVLPVPGPATAKLLAGKPIYARGPSVDLTTLTGAAILSALSVPSGPVPSMSLRCSGFGAGQGDFRITPMSFEF